MKEILEEKKYDIIIEEKDEVLKEEVQMNEEVEEEEVQMNEEIEREKIQANEEVEEEEVQMNEEIEKEEAQTNEEVKEEDVQTNMKGEEETQTIEKAEEKRKVQIDESVEVKKQEEDEDLKEAKRKALLDCFSRTYHFKRFSIRVFSDHFAHRLISEEEYQEISKKIISDIYQFQPNFKGTEEEALDWMMEQKVAAAFLGRNTFCEKKLVEFAENWGRQYFVFDSAYDTFGYRNYFPKLKVYEIDRAEMIEEKKRRLARGKVKHIKVEFVPYDYQKQNWKEAILQTGYDREKKVFCNLMGVSYRMSKEEFADVVRQFASIMCERSQIVLDYTMDPRVKNSYPYSEIYYLLQENGFEIVDYFDDILVTQNYFNIFNSINAKHRMLSLNYCCYCFAVKRKMKSKEEEEENTDEF